MAQNKIRRLTVSKLLYEIKNSSGEKFMGNFDNLLCLLMAPFIFLSSILILIYDYLENNRISPTTLIEFSIMLLISFSFPVVRKAKISQKLRHHLISILYSSILLFGVIRFYYVIGPAMWTFAFIQIVLSIAQNSKVMFLYLIATMLLAAGHASFNSSDMVFQVNIYYTIAQLVLFAFLGVVAKIIFDINNNHIKKVESQLISLKEEISQRKIAEEKNIKLALYDQLTGLPNRTLFTDCLKQALELAARNSLEIYVMFVDIDMFKLINDTLGHQCGDELLKKIGERMSDGLRGSDAICRVSGDEFLVMLLDVKNKKYIDKVASRMLKRISSPFELEGKKVKISASIGIAKYPDDGIDGETLIKRSDIAMYKAKQDGKNRYEMYSDNLEQLRFKEMEIVSSLQNALLNDEFSLHYQPQVDGKTKQVIGFEALIRWMHPTKGFLPAGEFIEIAEKSGLIVPIGEWVIKTACRQNKTWQENGMKPVPVAVNISISQINNYDLYSLVKQALDESGLEPEYLELEITETILAKETEMLCQNLEKIRELGVKITIDDFGTGYSAIQYLKLFPIDRIKIPMNFIHGISHNAKDESIICVILALAESMNIDVVAEGVETRCQFDFLMDRLCSNIQGFMFSKPMAPEDVESFVCGQAQNAE